MNQEQENEGYGETADNEKSDSDSPDDNEPYIPYYDKQSSEYSMNSSEKSLCYIFNHTKYMPHLNLKPREGADKDCEAIFTCFSRLQFEVCPCTDFSVRKIMETLNSVRKDDHTNQAAFVCFILSHGDHNYIYAYDGKYNVKDVYKYFYGNKCPTLVGKPKIFFIQACRGKKIDCGVTVLHKQSMDGDDREEFQIPSQADFLIAQSTVVGYRSFRNGKGSKFIIILCECLKEHANDKDLLQILTIVNQRLALFKSNCPTKPLFDGKKQMPCVWFTLTKQLKFVMSNSD